MSIAVNLTGLTDAIEALAGSQAPTIPIVVELPDGRVTSWLNLSIKMVPSEIEGHREYRALVVKPALP